MSKPHADLPAGVDPLAAYLADRDEPCPRCRYSLRGVKDGRCPECGRGVELEVVGRGMRRLWVLVLLALLGWIGLDSALTFTGTVFLARAEAKSYTKGFRIATYDMAGRPLKVTPYTFVMAGDRTYPYDWSRVQTLTWVWLAWSGMLLLLTIIGILAIALAWWRQSSRLPILLWWLVGATIIGIAGLRVAQFWAGVIAPRLPQSAAAIRVPGSFS